eukprot:scaffold41487_cov20-Tisochrysis_lutea.AAC.1
MARNEGKYANTQRDAPQRKDSVQVKVYAEQKPACLWSLEDLPLRWSTSSDLGLLTKSSRTFLFQKSKSKMEVCTQAGQHPACMKERPSSLHWHKQ